MKDWKEYRLKEVCEVGRGSSPRPIIDTKYFEGGKIPWIKIADATASGKYITHTRVYQ
jgi:type I restriction enzyme, S subunit